MKRSLLVTIHLYISSFFAAAVLLGGRGEEYLVAPGKGPSLVWLTAFAFFSFFSGLLSELLLESADEPASELPLSAFEDSSGLERMVGAAGEFGIDVGPEAVAQASADWTSGWSRARLSADS